LSFLLCTALVSCANATPQQVPAIGVLPEPKSETTPQPSKDAKLAANEPAPVSVYLDTKLARAAGRQITVAGGSGSKELQAAINRAKPGDEIILEAGQNYTGSFTLPEKAGDGWIIIRSSRVDQLPGEGNRVGPEHAATMPKLLAPGNNAAVIATEPSAHHYRFIGIEMSVAPTVTMMGDLIKLGDSSQAQSTLESVPHDLIIDRCYIHGRPDLPLKRAVALNSARTSVIDSYISDVHVVGQDTQAIAGWNGPGPFKIVGNYLEAAGENIMFGGSQTRIPNLVPEDIEIRRNHFFKPLSWRVGDPAYKGTRWTVKNLFELKNARRVLVDGNLFENCWLDGQTGVAVLIKTSNQNSGQPWHITEDVIFTNNIVRHAAGGITLLGRSQPETGNTRRIKIANNLFEDISATWGRNMGRLFQILDGVDYVTIDHNTCFQTAHLIAAGGQMPSQGLVFTNNIARHNAYGIKGDGASTGNDTINKFFPGSVFRKNAITGGKGAVYPSENFFPADMPELPSAGSRSAASRHFGTDGKGIGCDIEALQAAMGPLYSARLRDTQ
jgi:hypothetical protein